jgi:hypothetical protein
MNVTRVMARRLHEREAILEPIPVAVGLLEREIGLPVVVKTLRGTRGEGVPLCANREQFHDLANLLDGAQSGANFIFQQYVEASHGRDVPVPRPNRWSSLFGGLRAQLEECRARTCRLSVRSEVPEEREAEVTTEDRPRDEER